MARSHRICVLLLSLIGASCRSQPAQAPCPSGPVFETKAPGVPEALRQPDHWLAALPPGAADAVLLSPAAIEALNATNATRPAAAQDVIDGAVAEPARVQREIDERHAWIAERLGDGRYVEERRGSFREVATRVERAEPADELRVLLQDADLRCLPMAEGLFTPPADPAFDRNQCSGLHAGELLRVLKRTPTKDWLYVHAGHSVGWLTGPRLSAPLPRAEARRFRDQAPRAVVIGPRLKLPTGQALRMGASLPLVGPGGEALVPTTDGLRPMRLPADAALREGYLPLTRRHVFRLALSLLDHPYGWGEQAGGQDCSRLLLDVFATFGLRLGRHSSEQAKSGSRNQDLSELDEAAKLAAMRRGARQGVVVLYMPGHIMLYLGEHGGRPYAVSAISEYLRPCPEPKRHTVVRLDRVVVTDLELGRGTERTSFLERLTAMAVFGASGAY